MDKVLVKISFPVIEEKHEIWLPTNKKIYSIIMLLLKMLNELEEAEKSNNMPSLYNRYTGECYDMNLRVIDTDIKNGTELILI